MLLQLATVVCLIQIHLMVHHSISASSMTTMETDQLDINDILNANLMPARFLMLDNSDTNAAVTAANRSADTAEECVTPSSLMMMETGKPLDGTFTAALSTMGFHRRMIEKYLCSNYLAERILHKVAPSHFRRRVGVVAPNFGIKKKIKLIIYDYSFFLSAELSGNGMKPMINYDVKEAMRSDEGSSIYKNWLSKLNDLVGVYFV